jgi:hypothetical protein
MCFEFLLLKWVRSVQGGCVFARAHSCPSSAHARLMLIVAVLSGWFARSQVPGAARTEPGPPTQRKLGRLDTTYWY